MCVSLPFIVGVPLKVNIYTFLGSKRSREGRERVAGGKVLGGIFPQLLLTVTPEKRVKTRGSPVGGLPAPLSYSVSYL